jgi:hypothetical protein
MDAQSSDGHEYTAPREATVEGGHLQCIKSLRFIVMRAEEPFVRNDAANDNEENAFVMENSQARLSSKDGYGSALSEEPEDDETTTIPRRNVCLVESNYYGVGIDILLSVTQVAPLFLLARSRIRYSLPYVFLYDPL